MQATPQLSAVPTMGWRSLVNGVHHVLDGNSETPAIIIPRAVFWGLLVPLIIGICSGSAYMAGLSMTVAQQGASQAATNARLSAAETRIDADKYSNITTTGTIDSRLTRIEAQLSFLVKTSERNVKP